VSAHGNDRGSRLAATLPARAKGEARPRRHGLVGKPPEAVRQIRPNAPFTTLGVRRIMRRGAGLQPGEARASGHGGGCRMKRPVLLIALLTLTVVWAASVAQAEPGLQSKLTAISGQGTGQVVVSPTAQGQGAVFVAEGAAAIHDALPNTTYIVQRAIDFTPNDGACTIAPAPPAGWITLTTLTTSAGGAGAAHFERVSPPPGPSGFQFDIVFRVISTDGTQVLMSDCMTVTVK
jgi:hypothetical protein